MLETKRASITFPAEVLAKFRAAVFAKHGRLHGPLGQEANEALLRHAETLQNETRSA